MISVPLKQKKRSFCHPSNMENLKGLFIDKLLALFDSVSLFVCVNDYFMLIRTVSEFV